MPKFLQRSYLWEDKPRPITSPEKYIKRCIELASKGAGRVSPNPMVGCVIVHKDRIIGEGWHKRYGGPHAEVNAIESVKDKKLLSESTIYVSLEPCSIFGNTPPCADLIIHHKIPKVVIATLDDHPKVSGEGVRRLRDHGIQVECGICEERSRALNKYFISHQTRKRPYIHLKWAESADGFFAPNNGKLWLSNDYTKRLTHKWRRDVDAILVGKKTAFMDDPQLTDRFWDGHQLLRVILDARLELDQGLRLFTDGSPTLVMNNVRSSKIGPVEYLKMNSSPFDAGKILEVLHQRKIMSLLVEGGATTIQPFLDAGLFDEVTVFRTEHILGSGIRAPRSDHWVSSEIIEIAGNKLEIYLPE